MPSLFLSFNGNSCVSVWFAANCDIALPLLSQNYYLFKIVLCSFFYGLTFYILRYYLLA